MPLFPITKIYFLWDYRKERNRIFGLIQNTLKGITEEAELWARDFSMLSEEQLCDKAVEFTRKNVRAMNWSEDDIEGVTWFLGIYTRVILKAGLSKSFPSIMMTSLRKYFNII